MNIGIVGGGSIGLLMGSYLAKQHEMTLYVRRKEQKEQINEYGLEIDKDIVQKNIRALLLKEMKQEDCLIICVKQTSLPDVLPLIKGNHSTPLIFMQNGMGHLQMIRSLSNPLYVGIIEHGAHRVGNNKVKHTGKGKVKIAAFDVTTEQLSELTKALHQVNFPVEKANDWYELLTEKLVINAVINPLTALFNVENRYVIENPHLKNIAQHLCAETVQVLELDFSKHWTYVKDIVRKTGRNRSSMLSDIENKRPTEIEAITGYLVNLNKVSMPYTSFVYEGILGIELQKGIRK